MRTHEPQKYALLIRCWDDSSPYWIKLFEGYEDFINRQRHDYAECGRDTIVVPSFMRDTTLRLLNG